MNCRQAQELKLQANEAIKAGQLSEALALYSQAIELDRANHTLYSNRSYAYLKLGEKEKALRDADMCIDLKPDWAKVSYTWAALTLQECLVPVPCDRATLGKERHWVPWETGRMHSTSSLREQSLTGTTQS